MEYFPDRSVMDFRILNAYFDESGQFLHHGQHGCIRNIVAVA